MAMENTAKTLVKTTEKDFEEICNFFKANDITISAFEQDRVGDPIYMSLLAPKGHVEALSEELKPLILGNICGC